MVSFAVVSFAVVLPRRPSAFLRRRRPGGAPLVDFRESCRQQLELLLPVLGVAIDQTAASKSGPTSRLHRLMRPLRSCCTNPARTRT